MKTFIIGFVLGVLGTVIWQNPDVVQEWRDQGQARWDQFNAGIEAASEQRLQRA